MPNDRSALTAADPLAFAAIDRLGFAPRSLFAKAALALAGSLLIAVCAQIAVPMWPVPMTMQSFAVLLIGATLGWRLGMASVFLYLLEGASGLPVFQGFSFGGAALAGVTGGYLLAFIPAAGLTGWLVVSRNWARSTALTALAMSLATLLILAFGALWAWSILQGEASFTALFAIFLPGGALKVALAALAVAAGRRALSRRAS